MKSKRLISLNKGKRFSLPRRVNWLMILLVFLPIPWSTGAQAAIEPLSNRLAAVTTDADFATGEVLVGVHWDALPFSREKGGDTAAVGALSVFDGLSLAGMEILAINDAPDEPLFLRVHVADGDEQATIARLRGDPAIAFAEPNWIAYGAVMDRDDVPTPILPSDPLFRANQWGMQRVGAPRGWAIGQGAAIQVAVVDSGVDFGHPEFANRLLAGKNYVTPGTSPQDDSGHGTHVTGIIGASLNNGVGVAGLAPRAIIDPRKVLDSRNAGTISNIAQAIRDAADAGAKIINLSITTREASFVLESAVNYAVGKGILLVASAGNVAPNPVWWPAAYAGVLAVAATDRADQRAYYSHTGNVDLAAPGGLSSQLIYSTWPAGIYCQSTGPDYCTAFGTSTSAAFVSGAAALIWSTRPDLSLLQVRNILLDSAHKTGAPATDVGAGRLDVQAALRLALLSDIQPSATQLSALVIEGTQPFSQTISLRNPSGDFIFWQASVTSGGEWLAVQPSPSSQRASNTIRFGEPAHLSMTISPTQLAVGDHTGTVRMVGTRTNNSQIIQSIPVDLRIRSGLYQTFLGLTGRSTMPLAWQAADANGKKSIQLTDSQSVGLLLPFTFTLESQAVTTVRLYADGLMTFPASDSVEPLPIGCTPDETKAAQAIYGWWTDLNPDMGGTVSTFTSVSGAFVAEFLDVPLASATSPADRVSFQMALFANGQVRLNYAALPSTTSDVAVGDVAVGVEVNEGLLSSRIACRKGIKSLGLR